MSVIEVVLILIELLLCVATVLMMGLVVILVSCSLKQPKEPEGEEQQNAD